MPSHSPVFVPAPAQTSPSAGLPSPWRCRAGSGSPADQDHDRQRVVAIAVHGSWSRGLGLEVSTALRDGFAYRPDTVIVDLRGMTDDAAASLPLWLAARRAAAVLRPPVRLALCLPAVTMLHQRLRRIGAHRLPIHTTMAEARTAEGGADMTTIQVRVIAADPGPAS